MKRGIPALLAGLILLAACATPAPGAPRAPGAPAARTGADPAALIVSVAGQTALKRQGWREYAPLVFGAALRRGDLIRAEAGSTAVAACSDLSVVTVAPGVTGYPCTTAGPAPIVYEGGLVNATRGAVEGDYPLVLAPRKTKVLDAHPLLSWQAYGGAASYHVSLQGVDWATEVTGATSLRYPADAPPLVPGKTYRLVVTANGRSSAEEPGPGLGFTLLPAAEAEQVRADAARVAALGLAADATTLLTANLYAGRELYAEALQLLTAPANGAPASGAPGNGAPGNGAPGNGAPGNGAPGNGAPGNGAPANGVPALARLTGDLARTVGLARDAEAAYTTALTASVAAQDREGAALANRGLAAVYEMLGNPAEAARYFGQARAAFDALGDQQAVAEIDAALK